MRPARCVTTLIEVIGHGHIVAAAGAARNRYDDAMAGGTVAPAAVALSDLEGGNDDEEDHDADHEQRCLQVWVLGLPARVGATHWFSRCRPSIDGAVGTRRRMYQAPAAPAATIEILSTTLSRRSPTLIAIAMAIIEMAAIFARFGMPRPDR